MPSQAPKADVPFLGVATAVIFFLAAWGASFSRTCESDGCIGMVFPVGAALLTLAVQLFVLIPVHVIRSKGGSGPRPRVGVWIAASIAAFLIPMLFAEI
ncbi:hypothetical protein [Arenimonas sp. MALMAid1274]|uniref:hypothetical protein n=1 Tax=Arenimonas sp. MALMAid1274 TaxID=3411630 RepID=UPI003B9E0937